MTPLPDVLTRFADTVLGATDYVPTPLAWRSWRARRAARAFDLRHGTDTRARVEVEDLGVSEHIAAHAVHYEPSSIPKARCVLRHLGVRHQEYDFIDVGSGKGLVPLLAARYPFRSVVGIEASPGLHDQAIANLTIYRARWGLRSPVRFLNMDALGYSFGEANHVVYLYNPFDETMLAAFVDRLLSVPTRARLVVAYVNPVHRALIERTGAFTTRFDRGSLVVFCRML